MTKTPPDRAGLDLFLISGLVLFLELACIRWFPAHVLYLTFFTNAVLLAAFVALIYTTLFLGAITRVWGTDFTLTGEHLASGFARGWVAIRDTTLLSVIATPLTGLLGMLVAILVVRRNVPAQGFLDFGSMIGGVITVSIR